MAQLEKLGEYKIISVLGRGGMGVVYRGRQESLHRDVAIKVLPSDLTANPDFVARFYREARAVANIIHPNVIQIYTIGKQDNIHYFAMEYVEGEDLGAKLHRKEVFTMSRITEIIRGVCYALEAAREQGIIHRDIKPSNIMLGKRGKIKVMDFGLAKAQTSSTSVTQTGIIVGTVNYMSPEQGQGEPLDHRSDIYSLGVVMYELLTGRVPFKGDRPASVIYMHINKPPVPPREISQGIPMELERICMKAMGKEPQDRYRTAAEMIEDLDQFQQSSLYATMADSVFAVPADKAHLTEHTPTDVRREMEGQQPIQPQETAPRTPTPAPATGAHKPSRTVPALLVLLILAVLGVGGFFVYQQYIEQRNKPKRLAPAPAAVQPVQLSIAGSLINADAFPEGTYVKLNDRELGQLPLQGQIVVIPGSHRMIFRHAYVIREIEIQVTEEKCIPQLDTLRFDSPPLLAPVFLVDQLAEDVREHLTEDDIDQAQRILHDSGVPEGHATRKKLQGEIDIRKAEGAMAGHQYQQVLAILQHSPAMETRSGGDLTALAHAHIRYQQGDLTPALESVKNVHNERADRLKRIIQGHLAINRREWMIAHQFLADMDTPEASNLKNRLAQEANKDLLEKSRKALRKGEFDSSEKFLQDLEVFVPANDEIISLKVEISKAKDLHTRITNAPADENQERLMIALEELLKICPDFGYAELMLTQLQQRQEESAAAAIAQAGTDAAGATDETASVARTPPPPPPPSPDKLIAEELARAEKLFASNLLDDALEICARVLTKVPDHHRALQMKKKIRVQKIRAARDDGRIDFALVTCDVLLTEHPKDPEVLKLMLSIYLESIGNDIRKKQWDKAEKDANYVQTNLLPAIGDRSEALEKLTARIDLEKDATAFFHMVEQKAFADALQYLQQKNLQDRAKMEKALADKILQSERTALEGQWRTEIKQFTLRLTQVFLDRDAKGLIAMFRPAGDDYQSVLAGQAKRIFQQPLHFQHGSSFTIKTISFNMEERKAHADIFWQYVLALEDVNREIAGEAFLAMELVRNDHGSWEIITCKQKEKP